jgi:hypothetical protein
MKLHPAAHFQGMPISTLLNMHAGDTALLNHAYRITHASIMLIAKNTAATGKKELTGECHDACFY